MSDLIYDKEEIECFCLGGDSRTNKKLLSSQRPIKSNSLVRINDQSNELNQDSQSNNKAPQKKSLCRNKHRKVKTPIVKSVGDQHQNFKQLYFHKNQTLYQNNGIYQLNNDIKDMQISPIIQQQSGKNQHRIHNRKQSIKRDRNVNLNQLYKPVQFDRNFDNRDIKTINNKLLIPNSYKSQQKQVDYKQSMKYKRPMEYSNSLEQKEPIQYRQSMNYIQPMEYSQPVNYIQIPKEEYRQPMEHKKSIEFQQTTDYNQQYKSSRNYPPKETRIHGQIPQNYNIITVNKANSHSYKPKPQFEGYPFQAIVRQQAQYLPLHNPVDHIKSNNSEYKVLISARQHYSQISHEQQQYKRKKKNQIIPKEIQSVFDESQMNDDKISQVLDWKNDKQQRQNTGHQNKQQIKGKANLQTLSSQTKYSLMKKSSDIKQHSYVTQQSQYKTLDQLYKNRCGSGRSQMF